LGILGIKPAKRIKNWGYGQGSSGRKGWEYRKVIDGGKREKKKRTRLGLVPSGSLIRGFRRQKGNNFALRRSKPWAGGGVPGNGPVVQKKTSGNESEEM